MKKALSLIFTMVLLLALFVVPAYAAGEGALALSGAEGAQGETVTLNVNLASNPGLITMKFTVEWDEGLELIEVSDAELLGGWTEPSPAINSPYTLRWADSLSEENDTATGTIATLTFHIKEDAIPGNKTVTLANTQSWDCNGGRNTIEGATATVKVTCAEHVYTDENDTECDACGHIREIETEVSGTIGNITWVLKGTELTISGTGAIPAFTSLSPAPWGKNVTSVVVKEGITSIGAMAFYQTPALKTVIIEKGVTTIGNSAFNGCTGIETVAMPKALLTVGATNFKDCANLTDVYYEGTAANQAEISFKANNAKITEATWHYEACLKGAPSYAHAFDHACDADCNVCGFVRIPADHQYDNACDADCNVCGAVREVSDHVYDSAIDADCNECGEVRELDYDAYGQTGEVFWYVKDKVLTITGNGAMGNYSATAPWGNDITSVVIEEGVTSIGTWAFRYNTNLKTVTIGKGLVSIGNFAFDGCTNLISISLPKSLTTIGATNFRNSANVVVYYEGVEADKNKISIKANNAPIQNAAWNYDVCLSNPFTYEHVFDTVCDTECNACGKMRTVPHAYDDAHDPDCNLCGFGRFSAMGTTGDVFWHIENGHLTIYGNGAMGNYDKPIANRQPFGRDIVSVTIEEGVTSIGTFAFYLCDKLISVEIPNSVTSIAAGAFTRCVSLPEIILHDGIKTIGNSAFYCCFKLAYVKLPSNLRTIGASLFYECEKLTTIEIPETVISIGGSAFAYCDGLTTLRIPANVTKIGNTAFYYCKALTSIVIPRSVTEIGVNVCVGCTNFTDVYYEGTQAEYNSKLVPGKTIKDPNPIYYAANYHYEYRAEN